MAVLSLIARQPRTLPGFCISPAAGMASSGLCRAVLDSSTQISKQHLNLEAFKRFSTCIVWSCTSGVPSRKWKSNYSKETRHQVPVERGSLISRGVLWRRRVSVTCDMQLSLEGCVWVAQSWSPTQLLLRNVTSTFYHLRDSYVAIRISQDASKRTQTMFVP